MTVRNLPIGIGRLIILCATVIIAMSAQAQQFPDEGSPHCCAISSWWSN